MSRHDHFIRQERSRPGLEQEVGVQAFIAVATDQTSPVPFPRAPEKVSPPRRKISRPAQSDRGMPASDQFEAVHQKIRSGHTIPFAVPSSAYWTDALAPAEADAGASVRLSRAKLLTLISLAICGLAALAAVWYALRPQPLFALMVLSAAFNLAVNTAEARWRLHAWRTPEASESIAWPKPLERKRCELAFSLIVAARDEAAVIADTLRGLVRQKHPYFEIIVSLCDDDYDTIAAAREVAKRYHNIKIVIDHYEKGSKAHQLNRALEMCQGEIVGVFDAEDDVADRLLLHVEALFAKSGADIVQGGVQLMNLGDRPARWFQVHNVLEYYFWFTSRMAYQSDAGFVPLGGNTVFIYRDLLEQAGGWPISLTEDCSLGVLLATRFGAKVATAYSAELSTREEAPPTIFNKQEGSLFWQRDRWVRGFLAELMDGAWLKMPTIRQRALAGYILATPVLQGASAVLLPVALITALIVKAPIAIAMLMFAPLIPVGITVLTQMLGLREFSQTYGIKASIWHYASLAFLTQIYQLVLMAAAVMAAYKAARGDLTWYKTGRASQHRGSAAALEDVLEGAAS